MYENTSCFGYKDLVQHKIMPKVGSSCVPNYSQMASFFEIGETFSHY